MSLPVGAVMPARQLETLSPYRDGDRRGAKNGVPNDVRGGVLRA